MSVEAPGTLPAVTGAIRHASRVTGTNFQYLVATAQVESRMNPSAAAPTSSARGLFQFIEQTWLQTLKEEGPALGYNHIANVIGRSPDGQFVVSDRRLNDRIMKMRDDPTANAVMAGAYTKANASKLAERLGRDATEGELYIAHFLGANGAARMISLAETRPGTRADTAFPGAAKSNPSIFYDRGKPRSVGQVYRSLVNRYAAARTDQPAAPQLAAAASKPVPAPQAQPQPPSNVAAFAPDTALLTDAYAAAARMSAPPPEIADMAPVFHGLFRTSAGREAVAPVVSALWTAPTPVSEASPAAVAPPPAVATPAAAPAAAASPSRAPAGSAGGTYSLFQDLPGDPRALFRGGV
jgi:hypothetical protein